MGRWNPYHRFRDLPQIGEGCYCTYDMTHFPEPNPKRRAPRVQLGISIPALLKQEDGQRTNAKLQTFSVTGGLLHLPQAIGEGDFVEVAFQTRSGPVHGVAEMLQAGRSSSGVSQPFRFIALDDNDHRTLRIAIESIVDRKFLGLMS